MRKFALVILALLATGAIAQTPTREAQFSSDMLGSIQRQIGELAVKLSQAEATVQKLARELDVEKKNAAECQQPKEKEQK